MDFILSKVLFLFVAPDNILLLLLLVGLLLLRRQRKRAGRALVFFVLAAWFVIGFTPAPDRALALLEDRFARPDPPPARVDGIILLGGAQDLVIGQARGEMQLNASGDRITAFLMLARRYPEARLFMSGGTGELVPGTAREALELERVWPLLGPEGRRLEHETNSRNTWDNARNSLAAIRPAPGETWLLVTSAVHMPRAIGCFRQAGWTGIHAWPTDWRARPPEETDWISVDLGGGVLTAGMERLRLAVRESVGMAAYYLMGRIPELFPAPALAAPAARKP
ncbi:MAG: YdcF family protein [Alphaproteobacteria bacterium]|nr:YdcF family protein [Alphaproteobacteria bacterium]